MIFHIPVCVDKEDQLKFSDYFPTFVFVGCFIEVDTQLYIQKGVNSGCVDWELDTVRKHITVLVNWKIKLSQAPRFLNEVLCRGNLFIFFKMIFLEASLVWIFEVVMKKIL